MDTPEQIKPIETDNGRHYIPMAAGWEVQIKGHGSTFRLAQVRGPDDYDRWPVVDEHLHAALENMARAQHAALTAERQRAEAGEAELAHFKDPAMAPSQRYWEGRWRDEEKRADELAAHNAVLREALEDVRSNLVRLGWEENGRIISIIDDATETTPAGSLDALTQRVRAEAMEEK